MTANFEGQSFSRGTRESLIQSFSIEGLYGYRTLALDSDYSATIIIAKNGSGKTTLLSALYAFLKGQFARLKDLDFTRIRCRLLGVEDEIVINKEDIQHIFDAISESSELAKAARRFEVPSIDLFNFLEREFTTSLSDIDEITEHRIFGPVLRSTGYSRSEAVAACTRLRDSYYDSIPVLKDARNKIASVISEMDLVYLPTYRRIEFPLSDAEAERPSYRRRRTNMKFSDTGMSPGSVQFGLADVSERLRQLNQRLLADSNLSYREISANIINELIDGSFERAEDAEQAIPDRDELLLFFARLKDARKRGPYTDVTFPDIDKIYSREGLSIESNRVLTYFLRKLNPAIQATRDIEVMVEQFINICNKYLSRMDPTTVTNDSDSDYENADGKYLRLDRLNLKVYVESIALKKRITLNSLSSGEKQMISMFGSLYLYDKEKIVLIDEPELSLSIDWQRQLLVDFMNAPNCRQLVAITHSPFVFDNDLEPFARTMHSEIDTSWLDSEHSSNEDLDDNE